MSIEEGGLGSNFFILPKEGGKPEVVELKKAKDIPNPTKVIEEQLKRLGGDPKGLAERSVKVLEDNGLEFLKGKF